MLIFIVYWEFKKYATKLNKDALLEYGSLKQNDLLSTVKRDAIACDAVLAHNMRSLPRYIDGVLSDNRIINNVIIGFMET